MKLVRLIAVLLLLSICLPLLTGGSALTPPVELHAPTSPTQPTQPTLPATEPATEPPTQPPTAPPTEPPTQPPTEPGPTLPPEPTLEVTFGDEIPGISAQMAFVYDRTSQEFLYIKSELDAKLYPASITKLMNVYTALQHLDKDTVITVDADMLALVPIDTSRAKLQDGDTMTLENLIKGVLLSSGSDAAHILAVAVGRAVSGIPDLPAQDAESYHVALMNEQVLSSGMIHTHFANCDGYPDENHYTCMADLVTLAELCLNTPLIQNTVKKGYDRMYFTNGSSRRVVSTNLLLRTSSAYYTREACGLKTGTSNAAGACLLSVFRLGDRELIIGVFGCPTFYSRYDNALKLFRTYK